MSVDFLISYGIAMVMIALGLVIIYRLGVLNPLLTPVSCIPLAGFSCSTISMNSTHGSMAITISQALGGPITVNGVACSTNQNSTGDWPEYGNIGVTKSSAFYPSGQSPPSSGTVMYSDTSSAFQVFCYGPSGAATGSAGSLFFGSIWMNYTIAGYGTTRQTVMTVTAKYS